MSVEWFSETSLLYDMSGYHIIGLIIFIPLSMLLGNLKLVP